MESVKLFFSNPWVGIIATIISLIIGFIGLYVSLRVKRNKIEHNLRSYLDIGKGLSAVFPDFQLTYKGKPIINNVMVLLGRFKNISRDIKIDKSNNIIELHLPKECNIIEAKVVKSSHEKLIVEPTTKERRNMSQRNEKSSDPLLRKNTIVFTLNEGLFKSNEYFTYAVIFEAPQRMYDIELEFDHRFESTDIVKSDLLSSSIFAYRIVYLIGFLFGLVGLFFDKKMGISLIILSFSLFLIVLLLKYNKNFHKAFSIFEKRLRSRL